MLLNSGTPSLYAYTARLAGSPTSSQEPMYAQQEVYDALNEAYLMFAEMMRQKDQGRMTKRTYATTVADQSFYQLPGDFVAMVLVEVEVEGGDLSSLDPANASIYFPRKGNNETVLEGASRDEISQCRNYIIHGSHVGIFGAPEIGGSNSLRLTYEHSGVELSGDTDEPVIPRPFHRMLCRQAAIYLRLDNDLPIAKMQEQVDRQIVLFMRAVAEPAREYESQAAVAGRGVRSVHTVTGTIRHS